MNTTKFVVFTKYYFLEVAKILRVRVLKSIQKKEDEKMLQTELKVVAVGELMVSVVRNKPYAFAYLTKLANYKLITNKVVFVKVYFKQKYGW